jgi:hypothetical protein
MRLLLAVKLTISQSDLLAEGGGGSTGTLGRWTLH